MKKGKEAMCSWIGWINIKTYILPKTVYRVSAITKTVMFTEIEKHLKFYGTTEIPQELKQY